MHRRHVITSMCISVRWNRTASGSATVAGAGLTFGSDAQARRSAMVIAVLVARYRNVTVAMARPILSGGQKVTGPGAAQGAAMLVPWPGKLRTC